MTLLAATPSNESLGCYIDNPNGWLECALGQQANALGSQITWGLVVGGMLILTFYIATDGGIAVPSMVTAILGGVMIPALPPAYQSMAMVIMFLGLVGAILSALARFVMQPGGY